MKRFAALLLPTAIVALLGACGQARDAMPGTSGSPAKAEHGSSAVVVSVPVVATSSVARLRGDEDDDDEAGESKPAASLDSDSDSDNDSLDNAHKGYYDRDDRALRNFGHAAGAAERRALIALVRRYYAAAAADNGPAGCALTEALRAESLPGDYGLTDRSLHATTCAQVLNVVFERGHSKLMAPIEVTAVRVRGNRARVLLGSTAMSAEVTEAKRERGAWKIDRVLAAALP